MISKRGFVKLTLIFIVSIIFSFNLPAGFGPSMGADEKENKTDDKNSSEYFFVKKNEEVTVTATLTPQPLKDCTSSVSIMDKETLTLFSGGSALGVLGKLPGVFVNRSGDFGRADVDIRGLGQNCTKVAVLVDGKPEKMGLYGCAVSHAFPLDNVERIEVVKGSASVLYGGEALGGAINIITRMPQKPFELELNSSMGSYKTWLLNFKTGAVLGKLKFFATADKQKSDGHIQNAEYSGHSFTAKTDYSFSPNTHISLQGKYFDGNKHEPGTITSPLTNFWNDYKRGAVDMTFNHKWLQNSFFVKLYRNFGKHQFSDGWDSRDYTNGIMSAVTLEKQGHYELTLGGDYKHFGGKNFSSPKGKWNKSEGSAFFNGQYRITSRWVVQAGMRLQLDSIYDSEWCPQLSALYRLSRKTTLRAGITKGFRSPQLNELYLFPPSNTNLEPERSWNYEIGFDTWFDKFIQLKGTLFHMKGSNMIQTIPNPKGTPKFIFANTGEFSFYGSEIEMNVFFLSYFTGNIGFTYLDSGDYTKGRPGQKTDFTLEFQKSKFNAALLAQYVSRYYAANFSKDKVPSYFIMNIHTGFNVLPHLELTLDIRNLFDKN